MRTNEQERTINRAQLKALVWAKGEQGRTRVALGAEISVSMLEKLITGTYGRVPKKKTRDRLCAFLNVAENDLFPLVSASKKRSA